MKEGLLKVSKKSTDYFTKINDRLLSANDFRDVAKFLSLNL